MEPDPQRTPVRVLFHVHTRFSDDAWIQPRQLVEFARRQALALAIVTDHDTHQGSLECARLAADAGPQFPLSAEYRSNLGDLVAMYLSRPLDTRDAFGIIEETHEQGGLVVLPHPFKGKPFPDRILETVDLIEIFNARCSREQNARAVEAARLLGKPGIAGADAHLVSELGLAVNEYLPKERVNMREMLARETPSMEVASTTLRDIRYSQLLKAVRQFKPIQAAGQLVRILQTPRGLTP